MDVAVCPPSPYLDAVAQAVSGTKVGLGAQNLYHEPSGAFTGEISAAMVSDIGCQYVILGHSERRNVLGESNEDVNKKVKAALAGDLIPIVCVGELLEQREAGSTLEVIRDQFAGSLAGVRNTGTTNTSSRSAPLRRVEARTSQRWLVPPTSSVSSLVA